MKYDSNNTKDIPQTDRFTPPEAILTFVFFIILTLFLLSVVFKTIFFFLSSLPVIFDLYGDLAARLCFLLLPISVSLEYLVFYLIHKRVNRPSILRQYILDGVINRFWSRAERVLIMLEIHIFSPIENLRNVRHQKQLERLQKWRIWSKNEKCIEEAIKPVSLFDYFDQ